MADRSRADRRAGRYAEVDARCYEIVAGLDTGGELMRNPQLMATLHSIYDRGYQPDPPRRRTSPAPRRPVQRKPAPKRARAGRANPATRVWHDAGRAAVTDSGDLLLRACIVPWGVPARVTDDGRRHYTETWQRGSLVPIDRVVIYDGHVPGGGGPGRLNGDRQPIGRADSFESRPDGLYATLHLANTLRGRDVYELARTLGTVDVSLEADVPAGAAGTVARTAADPCALTGLAVVLPPGRGAFVGALAATTHSEV